jgi:hypothetical protein
MAKIVMSIPAFIFACCMKERAENNCKLHDLPQKSANLIWTLHLHASQQLT